MANEKTQSAMREVRDQLFINTADGHRLNIVTDNLGFFRPVFGFGNDYLWRAISKKLALGPKQIEWAFRQVLDHCVGPDFARSGVLATAVAVGDTTLLLEDVSDLIQLGTLIIDAGTANEESVEYCYVDYITNKVFLESAVANTHVALAEAQDLLLTASAATDTALVLTDSSEFPTTGYPYTILVGNGTGEEETVTVSNNNTGTNTLTVSALVNDHVGMRSGYLRKPLLNATAIGRTFIKFDLQDTAEFPEEGWIRIDANQAGEEIVFYNENDVDEDILFLRTPLVNVHAADASVELLKEGVDVRTASVVQEGIGWSIYDTTPKQVKIRMPKGLDITRLQDASFLHDPVPSPTGTATLAVATVAEDTVIELSDVVDFPDEAGLLTIDGSLRRFYTLRDEDASPNPTLTLTEAVGSVFGIGTTVDLYEIPYGGTLLEEGNIRDVGGAVQLDQYSGPYCFDPGEHSPGTVSTTITSLHPPTTEIMLDTLVGREAIEAKDLSLWPNTGQTRIGEGTGFIEDLGYTDITLAIDTIGSVVSSGGGVGTSSIVADTTAAAEPFPETVGANTCNYRVLVGAEIVSGSAETYALTDGWTLTVAVDGGSVQTATFNIGDFANIALATAAEVAAVITTDIVGATSADLGASVVIFSTDGGSLEVTGGTANGALGFSTAVVAGETVTVFNEDLAAALHTLTIVETFAYSHSAAGTVKLVNDVITVDSTVESHFAAEVGPTTLGHEVGYLTDTISLTTSVGFPQTVGFIFINFGNGRHDAETRLISVVTPTIYEFDDTSSFPTTDFPYQITLSPGRVEEEVIVVTANDTGTNRLTFSTTPVYTHTTGPAPFTSYAVFNTGDMELVEYQDVDGNDIILNPPQVINKHTIGESVVASGDPSRPRTDGFSYPFYLPPNNFICIEVLFEMVRAAGIQVSVVTF